MCAGNDRKCIMANSPPTSQAASRNAAAAGSHTPRFTDDDDGDGMGLGIHTPIGLEDQQSLFMGNEGGAPLGV